MSAERRPLAPSTQTAAAVSGVPLFDTRRQFETIRHEVLAAVSHVCESGRYILGSECERLETALAEYLGARRALGCASGSDALLLALMAAGVGEKDEVLMPSYTFFATASAAWRLGACPVFVDIDPTTYNLDPSLLEARVTPATKAIVPVHLYGQCADMDAVRVVARRHNLTIVEDAAQAIGAEYDGRRAGSLGDIGCFSFYPTKNLGAFGDAGLLTTDSPDMADRLDLLRAHGMRPRYYHQEVGINSRLDALQAAVLAVKLPHLDRWTEQRQTNATRYAELFVECGLDEVLALPVVLPRRRHVWNQYVVRVPGGQRDKLQAHLHAAGIGTEVYYPVPLHRQPCFQSLGYVEGDLPESERAARETLALPIFPELTAAEQRQVVGRIAGFYGKQPRSAPVHGVPRPKFLDAAVPRRAEA